MWEVIRRCDWIDWQLLTKRSKRIEECLPDDWNCGYDNVWLGVSVESQEFAERIEDLKDVSADVKFVSYEPALGPLQVDWTGIDWVIVGGESGPGYRPFDHDWARTVREQAAATGTAFFFKQSSAYRTELGIELDGEIVREYPGQ